MKKVLFRITNVLNIGGVQKGLYETLPKLKEYFDIHVIVYRQKGVLSEELEKQGIKVHFVNSPKTWDLKGIKEIAKILREYKADIVHTHSYGGCIRGVIAGKLAGVKTIIANIHAPMQLHWYGNFWIKRYKMMIIEKLLHKFFVKKILFASETLRNEYLHYGRLLNSEEKLEVLYDGYDLSSYLLEKRSSFKGSFKIGTMGRFVDTKNLFFFLKTALELLKIDKNFTFYMIGDGPMKGEFERFVKTNGIEEKIIFTGMIKNPIEILKNLDLYLFCSKTEGLGRALIEPLLLGIPCVVVDDPVNREVMSKGRGGEILNEDVDEFTRTIIEIKNNYQEYVKNLDFQNYRECFSMDKLILRYKKIYEI